jgi:hypothetical protein
VIGLSCSVCACLYAALQVRAFDNDEVVHVDDSVDPVRDLDTIQVGWFPACAVGWEPHRSGVEGATTQRLPLTLQLLPLLLQAELCKDVGRAEQDAVKGIFLSCVLSSAASNVFYAADGAVQEGH